MTVKLCDYLFQHAYLLECKSHVYHVYTLCFGENAYWLEDLLHCVAYYVALLQLIALYGSGPMQAVYIACFAVPVMRCTMLQFLGASDCLNKYIYICYCTDV